jgi:hypothetical protein
MQAPAAGVLRCERNDEKANIVHTADRRAIATGRGAVS